MVFRGKMEVNRFWFFCFVCSTLSALCDTTDNVSARVNPLEVVFPEGGYPRVTCCAQGGEATIHRSLWVNFRWWPQNGTVMPLETGPWCDIVTGDSGTDPATEEPFTCQNLTFKAHFQKFLRSDINNFDCKTELKDGQLNIIATDVMDFKVKKV